MVEHIGFVGMALVQHDLDEGTFRVQVDRLEFSLLVVIGLVGAEEEVTDLAEFYLVWVQGVVGTGIGPHFTGHVGINLDLGGDLVLVAHELHGLHSAGSDQLQHNLLWVSRVSLALPAPGLRTQLQQLLDGVVGVLAGEVDDLVLDLLQVQVLLSLLLHF